MGRILKPYGLWPTPLSAETASRQGELDCPAWAGETLVWIERQSDRSSIMVDSPESGRRRLAPQEKIGGKVGYGGGDLSANETMIVFAGEGGRLYRSALDGSDLRPLVPPFGNCASPLPSPDGSLVLYIHSDGETDSLAIVDSQGSNWPVKLASGADFYMQPAWHPDSEIIAWVEWDHPNMPWDGTRLMTARLDRGNLRLSGIKQVAGGRDIAIGQPAFSPDGRWLAFIQEDGEWQDLMLLNLADGSLATLVKGAGFEQMRPAWVQGMRYLAWEPSSESLLSLRQTGAMISLWRIPLGQPPAEIRLEGLTNLSDLTLSPSGRAALLASGPTTPAQLVVLEGGSVKVMARSENERPPAAFLTRGEEISWPSLDGAMVHGIYHPPANPNYAGQSLPPVIVNAHGGPTSSATIGYNASAALMCSKGYGWLEVNYRGSTGYGRGYRNALCQNWGSLDTQDTVSSAGMLAERGLGDANRIVVRGGSAGGYVVYNCLIQHPGVFKAGLCFFGVANLYTLDLETHKFEAHYTSSLVGELPEAAGRYRAWSPVFHAAKIKDPLAIFQGSDDKVVPQNQSDEIAAIVQRSGIKMLYKVYPGEGHGFRKAETILDVQRETERFLMMNVLFDA